MSAWLAAVIAHSLLISVSAYTNASSFQCDSGGWNVRTCTFTNLVLWRGQLHYVAEDPQAVELPEARLCERDPDNAPTKIASVLKVVTPGQLQRALQTGGARDGHHYKQALLLHPWVLHNYWHTSDDVGNVYLRLCKHFGMCKFSAQAVKDTALLAFGEGVPPNEIPLGVRQMYGCFASAMLRVMPWRNRHFAALETPPASATSARSVWPSDWDKLGVVRVGRVLFGVSDEMIPLYYAMYGLMEATPQTKKERIQYMRQCTGLPAEPGNPAVIPTEQRIEDGNSLPASLSSAARRRVRPHVVLVNRKYMSGRSILRLDEVYFWLRQRRISASLAFMDSLTMATQAKIFNSADILVVPHGAANGNFMFLPKHASILHVASYNVHTNHDFYLAKVLPPPWYNITFRAISSTNVDFTEPIMAKIRHNPGFLRVPPAWQASTLVNGTNLSQRQDQLNFIQSPDLPDYKVQDFPGLWDGPHAATFYLNLHCPPEWLVGNITALVDAWREKSRWRGAARVGEGIFPALQSHGGQVT